MAKLQPGIPLPPVDGCIWDSGQGVWIDRQNRRFIPVYDTEGNVAYDVILSLPDPVSPAHSLFLSVLAGVSFLWIPLLVYLIVKYGLKALLEPSLQSDPYRRVPSGPTQPENTKGKLYRFPQASRSNKN